MECRRASKPVLRSMDSGFALTRAPE